MRASKLMGSTVRNNAGDSVGDVNEIIIDKSGKVAAVIVGVGGFLGIGEREVALGYNQLQTRVDGSGNLVVTTNVTRDELKNAPAIQKSTTR
jgi:sporulation protein YlmC with PRC-barrel domain